MATSRVRRVRGENTEIVEEQKVLVTVQPFGQDAKQKQETIGVHKFITEPAYIRVSAGVTKSTGNYESLRIDVSYTIPCYKEEVGDTLYTAISDAIAERLDQEITQYLQLSDEA